jgi:signal transduction histidine kinase
MADRARPSDQEREVAGGWRWAPVDAYARMIREPRHGRLVRHYLIISVLLLGGGLIASSLAELYFHYQESRAYLGLVQREIAAAAAFKIERFVLDIEQAARVATKDLNIARRGLTPEHQFELDKLFMMSRAIAEVVAFDRDGNPRAQMSRFRLPEGTRNQAASAAFQEAMKGKTYFSPVYFVRGSEPYMTLAVPIERFAGEVIGVLRAEVSLRHIGEVVSSIQVGTLGYVYVASRSGVLVAHPELDLVLQQRDVGHLRQVIGAFEPLATWGTVTGLVSSGLLGNQVFSTSVVIPRLDWAVIVERPVEEAYAPLYASIMRTATLLLVGLGMALLAGVYVARRVVQPLQKLRQGLERIGRGELESRVELRTGDEFEIVGDELNRMAAALQGAYTGLEHKVAERTRELTILNEHLDEANKLKSKFLANVSHELRTPLNAIIGFTRLVLRKTEGQVPALQRENLQKVLISGEHLLTLINGLLDLSKIEAGRMEVFAESFRLEELIRVAAATVEPMLKDGRVRFVAQIQPDIPTLHTDRQKLKQVIINLLSNAAKFTEQGEIRVAAWHKDAVLTVAVSDTGIGMKKEVLDYIFEEFRQVDMSSTRKYGGTGLGLAIVKRLVHLLGGEIRVDSEPGQGSRFTLAIPLTLIDDERRP